MYKNIRKAHVCWFLLFIFPKSARLKSTTISEKRRNIRTLPLQSKGQRGIFVLNQSDESIPRITYILLWRKWCQNDAKAQKMPTSKCRHCKGLALICNYSHSTVAGPVGSLRLQNPGGESSGDGSKPAQGLLKGTPHSDMNQYSNRASTDQWSEAAAPAIQSIPAVGIGC